MYSTEAMVGFATAIALMMLFNIVGNILVIIAVLTSRALRRPQNLFLVSLAVADILVATLIIPFSLAKELMGYWYFHSVWCQIYLALDVLFCTSSIIHLCAISLDRYMSVTRPLIYGAQRTSCRIKCAILIVWLISAVISFPPLLSLNKNQGNSNSSMGPKCQLNNEPWYILYSTIGSFFTPCLIMILVYMRIYQIAKQRTRCPPGEPRKEILAGTMTPKEREDSINALCPCQTSPPISRPHVLHQAKIRGHSASSSSSSSVSDTDYREVGVEIPMTPGVDHDISDHMPAKVQRYKDMITTGKSACHKATVNREKRFTFVLAVVIGVFVVCWFPFFFSYSLEAVCPETCKLPKPVFTFFFWIGYCNSCLNPVIYTIFNKDFRRAFKRILSKNTKGTFY